MHQKTAYSRMRLEAKSAGQERTSGIAEANPDNVQIRTYYHDIQKIGKYIISEIGISR